MSEYLDVDVSAWEAAGAEPMGTKQKQWLYEPGDGRRWLWKKATENPRPDNGGYYQKGDDWAEKVASVVGASLGVPTATVELAFIHEQPGIISLDFTGGRDLVHGNELLAGHDSDYSSSPPRGDPRYSVAAVFAVLEDVEPPLPDPVLKSASDWFAGYLVLDALIGNTDRHHHNWAVLREDEGQFLAPSFDHASSLGFLLSDEERTRHLDEESVGTWADRATTPFADRPHPIDLAISTLSGISPEAGKIWLGKLEAAIASGREAIAKVPPARMSEVSKRFAEGILSHNGARMMSEGPSRIGA